MHSAGIHVLILWANLPGANRIEFKIGKGNEALAGNYM
jgi:hypothetical protein